MSVPSKRESAALEAADIIGIDRGHLSRIERGHRCPSPEVAERIATLYQLPIATSDRLMAAAALTRAYGRPANLRYGDLANAERSIAAAFGATQAYLAAIDGGLPLIVGSRPRRDSSIALRHRAGKGVVLETCTRPWPDCLSEGHPLVSKILRLKGRKKATPDSAKRTTRPMSRVFPDGRLMKSPAFRPRKRTVAGARSCGLRWSRRCLRPAQREPR